MQLDIIYIKTQFKSKLLGLFNSRKNDVETTRLILTAILVYYSPQTKIKDYFPQ
jgi:hypothetical protein